MGNRMSNRLSGFDGCNVRNLKQRDATRDIEFFMAESMRPQTLVPRLQSSQVFRVVEKKISSALLLLPIKEKSYGLFLRRSVANPVCCLLQYSLKDHVPFVMA